MAICPFSLTKEQREIMKTCYFEPKVIKRGPDECWDYKGAARLPQGYKGVTISEYLLGKKYTWPAHRLAWIFHNNCPIPPHLMCCHSCDNPKCVNPDHLFIATQKQNIRDARLKGRMYHKRYLKPREKKHAK